MDQMLFHRKNKSQSLAETARSELGDLRRGLGEFGHEVRERAADITGNGKKERRKRRRRRISVVLAAIAGSVFAVRRANRQPTQLGDEQAPTESKASKRGTLDANAEANVTAKAGSNAKPVRSSTGG
jgi:hypothetical protein